MEYSVFNINDQIKLKLTDLGLAIYNRSYVRLGLKPPELRVDDDGRVEMQLWCVMETFGPYMHIGMQEQPFACDILIPN